MQHPQNFCHCRKRHRTGFLDLCVGWSVRCHHSCSFVLKNNKKNKGPNQASTKGGGPQPGFWWPKIATDSAGLWAPEVHISLRATTCASLPLKFACSSSERSNLPVIWSDASLVIGGSSEKFCHTCLDDLWRDKLNSELSSGVASHCSKFEWHCLKAV